MSNKETEIAGLRAKVADLEARLAALTDKHQRDVKALMGSDDVLFDFRRMLSAEISDVLDRLVKLELLHYPHVVRDMDHLRQIIGPLESQACNPLDFRGSRKKTT